MKVSDNARRARPADKVAGIGEARTAGSPAAMAGKALVVGVGPGLGHALARKLASAGMSVAVASRNAERLDPLVASLNPVPGTCHRAYGCDATDERSVRELFARIDLDMGGLDLVIYAVQGFGPGLALEVEVPAFEDCWRQNCLGAFLVAREAGRRMAARGSGSILLIGSTSGLIARASHLNLAVGKFGLRALSQVMARELWPQGVHVAHCVIDADIDEGQPAEVGRPQADPAAIAETLLMLHRQPRSCWTSELDLRPSGEKFWEHC